MKAFTNAIGLGRLHLGFCVVDVVDGQEQLIVVFVGSAAEHRAPVGQDAQRWQVVFLVERQHPIIEQVGGGNRRFGGVEFGVSNLAIGVHIGLLIDPPDALECTDVERVLRAQIAGVGRFDLAAGPSSSFFFSNA